MNTTTEPKSPFLNPDPKCSFLKKVNPYCIQVYNVAKPYAIMVNNAFWIYANLYNEFQKKYNIHKHLTSLAEENLFVLLTDFVQKYMCLFYIIVMILSVVLFSK